MGRWALHVPDRRIDHALDSPRRVDRPRADTACSGGASTNSSPLWIEIIHMTQIHETRTSAESFDLADRYRIDSGPVMMTGVQAIARQLVEQHERDRRAGLNIATFVSGYQGSPLAGLDKTITSARSLRAEHEVNFVPGMNEELAATAVWGSQTDLPRGERTHDGVVGVWYGKGPGLDRASDSIRHAAMYGSNPRGGVLALVGDDPNAKSSTIPCASERSMATIGIPVFFPRNAEEVIQFGLYGVALSRISGCWSGLKIVADVADGLWTLDRDFSDLDIVLPEIEWNGKPWTYRQRVLASPPDSLLAEADLYGPRWAMVEAFNAANEIDRIEVNPTAAWLGIAAVGTAYDSLRQALLDLGLGQSQLEDVGIRILRIGMPYPLGADKVRALADGVEQLLVVEEKMPFVESQLKEILYGSASAPLVLGKRNAQGKNLIPVDGELTAARLAGPLRRLLKNRVVLTPAPPLRLELSVLPTARTPYFCSGCPHNRSTAVPEGSIAGGGIGCHALVTMSGRTDELVIHRLRPLRIQPVSVLFASVVTAAGDRSLDAPGSLVANDPTISPAIAGASHRRRCVSVPWLTAWKAPMNCRSGSSHDRSSDATSPADNVASDSVQCRRSRVRASHFEGVAFCEVVDDLWIRQKL